jgi:hypothetical protein
MINPYASPQIDGYNLQSQEVGVWQDGELIVMHVSATLPPICVKTGKPAEHYSDITIRWVQNFLPWNLTIKVPLTWAAFRAAIAVPVAAFLAALVFTAALVGAAASFGDESILLMLLVVVLAVATIVMGIRALNALGNLLRVHRTDGKYLWLSGAGPLFLRQLPEWEKRD